MNRVALYLRRSTDKQDKSIEDQRKFLHGYAAERGWIIVTTYCDDAISGDDIEKRMGFRRMLEDAAHKTHPFDIILCFDQSRFGRFHGNHYGYYLTLLEMAKVVPVFAMDPTQDGSGGRISSFVNQEQKHLVVLQASRDTIRGLVLRVTAGHSAGMPQPYGYDQQVIGPNEKVRFTYRLLRTANKMAQIPALHHIVRSDGTVEITEEELPSRTAGEKTKLVLGDPAAVDTVRRIFDIYAHRGLGFKAIAKLLNSEGIPSPRGRQWQLTTIKAILENPVYVGDLVWNRRGLSKYHQIEPTVGGGYQILDKTKSKINLQPLPLQAVSQFQPKKDPRSDWFITKDAHPAIISRKLFEKVQEKLSERSGMFTKGGTALRTPYLLSAFLNCYRCGNLVWGGRVTNGKKLAIRYYHCSSHEKTPNTPCTGRINADQLEYSLLNWIIEQFDLRDLKKEVEVRVREVLSSRIPRTAQIEARKTEEAIKAIDAKIDALLDKVLDLPKEVLNEKVDQLSRERERLKGILAPMRDLDLASKRLEFEIQEVMSLFGKLEEALMGYNKLEVQKLLKHLVKDVKVDFERKEVALEIAPEGLVRKRNGGPRSGTPLGKVGSGGGI